MIFPTFIINYHDADEYGIANAAIGALRLRPIKWFTNTGQRQHRMPHSVSHGNVSMPESCRLKSIGEAKR